MIDIVLNEARRTIERAGAVYVGRMDRLILFNSPATGSTLALDVRDVLRGGPGAVRHHIAQSDRRFGRS